LASGFFFSTILASVLRGEDRKTSHALYVFSKAIDGRAERFPRFLPRRFFSTGIS
jgi:hypothetical protein